MKRFFSYICVLSLLLIAVISCNNEKDNVSKTGTVRLGVEKNEILYTKAGEPVTDEILNVSFINTEGETVEYFNDYKTEVLGEDIMLPSGDYTIVVSSMKKEEPQWEIPFYYGETEVTVIAGTGVKASVECSIANTKVTVEYSDDVDDYFSEYNAVVEGKSGALTFEQGEIRAGFYFTETLSVTLNLTNKNNGLEFQFKKIFSDIQPQYHYIIRFDLGSGEGESSGGDFGISIDDSDPEEIKYVLTIPEYAKSVDMPKAPEMEIITQFSEGESTNLQDLVFVQKEDKNVMAEHTVTIHTEAGIRNLYMKLSDSFENLPNMFDLLKADEIVLNELRIEKGDPENETYRLDLTDMVNNYLKSYELAPKKYAISLIILDKYHQEVVTELSYNVKPDLPLMVLEPYKWATFAVLNGFGSDQFDSFQFKYGRASEDESSWNVVDALKDNEGNLSALVQDLKPDTEYKFKVLGITNDELQEGEVYSFVTCGKHIVPNMGFDDWYKPGDSYFLASENDYKGNNYWWSSGNEGANTMSGFTGVKNPTSPESSIVVNGKAAKLASDYISFIGIGKFAAGNAFIGRYVSTIGTSGAELIFGKEYMGKPTKLTGFLKYTSGIVDYTDISAIKKGDSDQCHIYIALTTKAYDIDTSDKSTLFNPDDSSVIAYGEFISDKDVEGNEPNGYQKFEIDLKYKDLETQPTHIVLVASASRYGDYFSGSTKSVLYLDEFNLEFDYNPASFTGTNSVLENK